MRELLIRYLLGELEPHEHDAVQQQLAESPELRRELAHLRACFANSRQDNDPDEPPRGLAERTATWVSESDSYDALPARPAGFSEATEAAGGVLGWSLADLTVAGGVMLAVSMLLFPALRNSLEGTRREMCLDNLHFMSVLLLTHADNHGGYLPLVQPYENVGMYAQRLVEGGAVGEQDLERALLCQGSPDARLARANPNKYAVEIWTDAELEALSPDELAVARAWMSPSYAYPMGYVVGRQYHFVRIHGSRMPILCDAPSDELAGMSPNHFGKIIQVLYADGSTRALTSAKLNGGHDDIYSNIEGVVGPGNGREDIVLGPSEATPGIFFINPERSRSFPMQGRQLHRIQIVPPSRQN